MLFNEAVGILIYFFVACSAPSPLVIPNKAVAAPMIKIK